MNNGELEENCEIENNKQRMNILENNNLTENILGDEINQIKIKSNLSSKFSNNNKNITNNINSNTNDISIEEMKKNNINNISNQIKETNAQNISDININRLSSFIENINNENNDIINLQKEEKNDDNIENIDNKVIIKEDENNLNNEELLEHENNPINLSNIINDDILDNNENKKDLIIQDEDLENINDAIVEKEYSVENQDEIIKNDNNNIVDEEIQFNSNEKKENKLDDENELLNYKNNSDSEKMQNKNENKTDDLKKEIDNEINKRIGTNEKDDNIDFELYSYENVDNNINQNNDNLNEEYFINQNIINLQNKFKEKEKNKDKEKYDNNGEKKELDKVFNNNQDKENELKINKEKNSVEVTKDNKFELSNNDINLENQEEKEDNVKIESENELSNQKQAMKALQLFISEKESNYNYNTTEHINEKKDESQPKIDETKKVTKNVIYKKNRTKIPYKKFENNSTNNKIDIMNKLTLKSDNTQKDVNKEIFFEKYKTLEIPEKDNNKSKKKKSYNLNLNSNFNKEEIKNKKGNYYKTAYLPYNNYIQFFHKTELKNKNKNTNLSKKGEENKSLLNTKSKNIKDYSFDGVVYQKRNIKNDQFLLASISRVYSKKNNINPRRNTFGKYKISNNQILNNDTNISENSKKKMININPMQLYTPINYTKKVPLSGKIRVKNNNCINNINYAYEIKEKNNNNLRNINERNSTNNNKNIYLFNSKTNKNLKDKVRMLYNTNNMDLSNDEIFKNKYIFNLNNNFNINFRENENNDFNIYKRNKDIYNTMKNFQRNNRNNNFNQRLAYNIRNIKIENKNDNSIGYYDEDYDKNKDKYQDKNYPDNYYYKNNFDHGFNINIEDLVVLVEKLNEIIDFLKSRKDAKNQCYDFLNFFYFSSLKKLENTFKSENITQIIRKSINSLLLSVLLCYEFSFDEIIINKIYILLLEILKINFDNIRIICENILYKAYQINPINNFIQMLSKMISYLSIGYEKYNYKIIAFYEKINSNNDKLIKKVRNILLNYQTEFSPLILSLSKKINQKNYDQINDFFQEYILRKENDLIPNNNINQIRPPYILSERKKKFTLILSLDETLVHLERINYNQCSLKIRPYLTEFLESVKPYYELILFTTKTQYYITPILKVIERNKNYFDFIFYREHCIVLENNYVKDLTRIGRSLDSTIIVDNIPYHFKLQNENGINIKSFWAQNPNDRALYDLIHILVNIALEEVDVRDGLEKYKEEIVGKIVSNVYDIYSL